MALTPTELAFKNALDLNIPPYNWLPPEAPPLRPSTSRRGDYSTSLEDIEKLMNSPQLIKDDVKFTVDAFNHIDEKEHDHIEKDLKAANENAKNQPRDPAAQAYSRNLQAQFDEVDKPYRRLKLAFNAIVLRVGSACQKLNQALVENNLAAYQEARQDYIDLLRYLDTHALEPNSPGFDPDKRLFSEVPDPETFGYGQVLMWGFVDPVIEPSPKHGGQNLITGITVVTEWKGYHTSSSGVPIP